MTYYIGQEVTVLIDTHQFKKDDKIIIAHAQGNYLFDERHKSIHINNVKPSFAAGDTVWDTHNNTTFVVHHVADDQVYSSMPGTLDGSLLRGRHISRVRSGTPPQAPTATIHPDTARLDWLSNNIPIFVDFYQCTTPAPDSRFIIDHLRTRNTPTTPCDNDGWIPWNGGRRPVPPGTAIEYKLRCGSQYTAREPEGLSWQTVNYETNPYSIVAYRVVRK